MNILKNKYLQFGFEAFLIAGIAYFLYQSFPSMPWWAVAVIAGGVAFVLDADVKSFWTGFTGVALLWGIIAFQMNELNADLLANKIGEMLSGNEYIAKIGGLNATRMIYVTAILGGIVGGFGAMTGSYARMMFYKKEVERAETLKVV